MEELPTTAHDLAACWSWTEQFVGFRVKGGTVVWEDAEYGSASEMGRVKIARIVPTADGKYLKVLHRYVAPETSIELVKK